jgi:septal ring factor EnvC (AmiA/AmiB activator)
MDEYAAVNTELQHERVATAGVERKLARCEGDCEAKADELREAQSEIDRLKSKLADFKSLSSDQG